MSLGAIDFGLIVDGAVIIVESIVHRLQANFGGQKLTVAQMNHEVKTASQKIRSSAAFGEIIILMVYIPILGTNCHACNRRGFSPFFNLCTNDVSFTAQ